MTHLYGLNKRKNVSREENNTFIHDEWIDLATQGPSACSEEAPGRPALISTPPPTSRETNTPMLLTVEHVHLLVHFCVY